MPYVNDPGNWSQVPEEAATEQAEFPAKQYACRCPRCDRFGTVQAMITTMASSINVVVFQFVG